MEEIELGEQSEPTEQFNIEENHVKANCFSGKAFQSDLSDSDLYEEKFEVKTRKSNYRFFTLLLAFATLILMLNTVWTSLFGGVTVSGDSMKMTLFNGEEYLMKYYREGDELERGDVIVVDVRDYPECRGVDFLIKRLIAVEGDSLYCRYGQIYIKYAGTDEYVLLEESTAHYMMNQKNYHFSEYTVGEGEIFFLGDNRQNSLDSRYKDDGSHLKDRLYKVEDIYGIVPDWAIENRKTLHYLFFFNPVEKLKSLFKR